MIDYAKQLKTHLQSLGLPVYAEMFLTTNVSTPCITYIVNDDQQRETGTTFGYSYVYYSVKVWSKKIKDLEEYSVKIDGLMRSLGFRRIGVTELWQGDMGQKQMRYRALAREKFK